MSKYFKAYKFLKDKAGTITGVAPDLKKTVKETKSDEYLKRIDKLDSAQKKLTEGKKMMKEAQKERKKLVDTGRAFQFKGLKSYHAMNPAGDKTRYAKSMKVPGPQKKFLKGKELEKKAKGGRIGLKAGTNPFAKKSNIKKIQETFGPKKPKKRMQARKGSPDPKKKFPDLTGDGKVTFADVLKGRGVINGKKKQKKKVI